MYKENIFKDREGRLNSIRVFLKRILWIVSSSLLVKFLIDVLG